ncbi:MAG: hypothetical protein LBG81_08600, partial [Coriobacteriaceae bacterium]|nr:hypothetical protein [Coriobacteriaceae bacterium]
METIILEILDALRKAAGTPANPLAAAGYAHDPAAPAPAPSHGSGAAPALAGAAPALAGAAPAPADVTPSPSDEPFDDRALAKLIHRHN